MVIQLDAADEAGLNWSQIPESKVDHALPRHQQLGAFVLASRYIIPECSSFPWIEKGRVEIPSSENQALPSEAHFMFHVGAIPCCKQSEITGRSKTRACRFKYSSISLLSGVYSKKYHQRGKVTEMGHHFRKENIRQHA